MGREGGDVNPDGSIRIKWWLPDGLSKEVLKALKPTLRRFEGFDLTCAACESEIDIHHDVLLAVQLMRQDNGLGIFLTHPLCAAPRVRFDPVDIPFVQGVNARQIHYLAAVRPSGEPLILIDISTLVHGVPKRHQTVLSATKLYAEVHGFDFSVNATLTHLAIPECDETKITVVGKRAFLSRKDVGITDELDLSSAGAQWRTAVDQAGHVEVIAGVGLLRLGPPDLRAHFPALAHGKMRAAIFENSDFVAPVENVDDTIYKVLNIAPNAQPTVFMLDSDVIVCIDRWFYGSGWPFTPVMKRQLEGLLTLRTLIGPMQIDYVLGVAENCWGRFSDPVDKHRARKIIRAVNTVLSLDSEALMELINKERSPAQAIRASDAFSFGMPRKESELQTMSYALILKLQSLYRKSRGANLERKLRLLGDYVEELDRDLGFVGMYEFQIACDFLFPGRRSSGYAELLLKPGKERRVLESSWGAAWDLTHMRRADLALKGIHWDIPEFAALVSGDKALRLLRDRLTVHRPVEVQGVSALQMNLSSPKFKSDRDTARFSNVVDHVHEIIQRNLHVTREQNVEKARTLIRQLESELTA
ncbi:hypothetical protein ACFVU4_21200 [Streptomyces sp. NPDC058107]|uniref:hypothetical protein n=1 Tax=Streptomyces sp. NPDC058107 TaxID=3346343 RepID=UPI0036EAEAAB